jgi:hypothetical protein
MCGAASVVSPTKKGTRLGRLFALLAEPGSPCGRSVVVPAAADGVSRSSQYGQHCADDKEDDTEDEQQVGEGKGRDEAGEEKPENDENNSETDHDIYLISADA